MSLSLQEELQVTLLDLTDDVKVELSELNQRKDNVTKGPLNVVLCMRLYKVNVK